MIDIGAVAKNSFLSRESFEKKEVIVVKCAECGMLFGDERGVLLFCNEERAVNEVAKSSSWWLIREAGMKVLCPACYHRVVKDRLEDESYSSELSLLVEG